MFIMHIFIIAACNQIMSQSLELDSINFYDKTLFEQTIKNTRDGKIDYIVYEQITGTLKKIDFFDHNQRITKDQIWDEILLREIKYSYLEKGQIIKRFDVLNNQELQTQLLVHFNYPAMARENEIEGKIEIKLTYDEDCIPIQFEILNKLGHGIEKEVEDKMQLILFLSKKYKVKLENCRESANNFIINFKLD